MKNPIDLTVTSNDFLQSVQMNSEAMFKNAIIDIGISVAFDFRRIADSLEKLAKCVKSDFSGHKFFDTSGIDKG